MPSLGRLLAASCAAVLVAACGSTPDGDGNYVNGAQALFRRIGTELAPGHAPP